MVVMLLMDFFGLKEFSLNYRLIYFTISISCIHAKRNFNPVLQGASIPKQTSM